MDSKLNWLNAALIAVLVVAAATVNADYAGAVAVTDLIVQ